MGSMPLLVSLSPLAGCPPRSLPAPLLLAASPEATAPGSPQPLLPRIPCVAPRKHRFARQSPTRPYTPSTPLRPPVPPPLPPPLTPVPPLPFSATNSSTSLPPPPSPFWSVRGQSPPSCRARVLRAVSRAALRPSPLRIMGAPWRSWRVAVPPRT
ncbi:hypothetical protein C8F04DRAFT_57568 [Mycena alexandri]|uniref:Uncharacterized protein n=1 Tax=Mycena alexandri TaxID=1745969 RepID=A0AAD6XF32_9AGAR|nr:hypothetical protein C8F04DRAFT_57568 [Mycena alexandri]